MRAISSEQRNSVIADLNRGAYGFVYDDPHYWPTNLVTSLLGHDIPHLEDDGSYEFNKDKLRNNYISGIGNNVYQLLAATVLPVSRYCLIRMQQKKMLRLLPERVQR